MLSVSIQANPRDMADRIERLATDVRQKVIARALRKAANGSRAETARAIKDEYKISSRVVRKSIKIRTFFKAPPKAEITVKGGPLPIYAFKPRKTAAGIKVRIKGRAVLFPHSFIATMRSGHIGVFARGGSKTYPLRSAVLATSSSAKNAIRSMSSSRSLCLRGSTTRW